MIIINPEIARDIIPTHINNTFKTERLINHMIGIRPLGRNLVERRTNCDRRPVSYVGID